MARIIATLIIVASASTLAACGSSSTVSSPPSMKEVHERAKKLAPENTAKRLERTYRKRGVPGRVHCVDVDASHQRRTVTDPGAVVARLRVTLHLDSGVIDAVPES
jgi:hypothetical protein